jgi:hypothetical protein
MERPFSVVSVQRGYLEDNRRYEAVSGQISKCEYVKTSCKDCNCVNV